MADVNTEEIKKLRKGELLGLIATIAAGITLIALGVLLIIAAVREDSVLRLCALLLCLPVGIFSLIAAVCNLKYGRALDRTVKNYVQDGFIENAALMHPERDSLTYYVSGDGLKFYVKTNNFKEQIIFDFSAFGKLSAVRRASVFTAIVERLSATYCRLYERGGKYKSVSYAVIKKGKQGKTVFIIENGEPEKKTYKHYVKQK